MSARGRSVALRPCGCAPDRDGECGFSSNDYIAVAVTVYVHRFKFTRSVSACTRRPARTHSRLVKIETRPCPPTAIDWISREPPYRRVGKIHQRPRGPITPTGEPRLATVAEFRATRSRKPSRGAGYPEPSRESREKNIAKAIRSNEIERSRFLRFLRDRTEARYLLIGSFVRGEILQGTITEILLTI